ncbi:hypothetical protein ACFYNO_09045 [Kitasatospora sp. NPDC006697]|uniref:hypothetical protein n=1 Tax=Kitasatospora sp. NPDC006697 TaxID=3364020 RepID=UPI003684AF83
MRPPAGRQADGRPGRAERCRGRGFADWERATAAASQPGRWHRDLIAYLTQVAGEGRHPHLTAALAEGGGAPAPDPDATFARFLDRLLTVLFQT